MGVSMHELSYHKKILLCKPWLSDIVCAVKKDLKQEHLAKDPTFCKRYFLGKSFNQITKDQLAAAYLRELEEGNGALAEFICTRWLLKHTDIYALFEIHFQKIAKDFEEIAQLDVEIENALKKESVEKFGFLNTFIFSLFNSVVFSEKTFLELKSGAQMQEMKKNEEDEKLSLQKMQERYERKISSLCEKYEKKLSGFQKKYLKDIKKLQQEISHLRKSHEL